MSLVQSLSFRRSRRRSLRRRPSSLMADGTLVRFALCQGSQQQVPKLFFGSLQRHTDLSMADGQLPLNVAVDADRPEIVVFLLSHGAHVNKSDSAGWTALHHAVYKGNINLVKILLHHGADPNVKAGHLLPIDLAMDCDSNMTELLHQASTISGGGIGEVQPVFPSKTQFEERRGSYSSREHGANSPLSQVARDASKNTPKSFTKKFARRPDSLLKQSAGSFRRR